MSGLHLLTYDAEDTGTKNLTERIARQADSARKYGCFETILTLGPGALMGRVFPVVASAALAVPRGAGAWVWKPYVILRHLLEIPQGDVLLYLDGDLSLQDDPSHFALKARDLGVATCLGWEGGTHVRFTKRDCLIRLDADREPYLSAVQAWAAAIAVHNVPQATMLIVEWLLACCAPDVLTDSPSHLAPEHPGFLEHRYDQSVLSIVLMKSGVPFLPNAVADAFGHPTF
jgi:hypothetical protein